MQLITDSTTKDTTKNLISSRTIATNFLMKLFGDKNKKLFILSQEGVSKYIHLSVF
jgi:hypothetical protein